MTQYTKHLQLNLYCDTSYLGKEVESVVGSPKQAAMMRCCPLFALALDYISIVVINININS
jgi:hypothetical protein